MSWDVMLIKLPDEVNAVSQIPHDYLPVGFGRRLDVIDDFKVMFPGITETMGMWDFATNEYSISFNTGDEEEITSLMFHVHGQTDKFIPQLLHIAAKYGLKIMSGDSDEFLNEELAKRSAQRWQEYRNKVINNPQ